MPPIRACRFRANSKQAGMVDVMLQHRVNPECWKELAFELSTDRIAVIHRIDPAAVRDVLEQRNLWCKPVAHSLPIKGDRYQPNNKQQKNRSECDSKRTNWHTKIDRGN